MKKISVTITDEQQAQLEEVQKCIGVSVSLQVRRALDLYIRETKRSAQNISDAVKSFDASPQSNDDHATLFAALKREVNHLGTDYALEIQRSASLLEQKANSESDTLLTEAQAQEIAQKLGKPLDALYERVPAPKATV